MLVLAVVGLRDGSPVVQSGSSNGTSADTCNSVDNRNAKKSWKPFDLGEIMENSYQLANLVKQQSTNP